MNREGVFTPARVSSWSATTSTVTRLPARARSTKDFSGLGAEVASARRQQLRAGGAGHGSGERLSGALSGVQWPQQLVVGCGGAAFTGCAGATQHQPGGRARSKALASTRSRVRKALITPF